MDEADDYGDMLAPTPQQRAAALAAALRGQQPQQGAPAPLLFAMGENPVTQPYAKEAIQSQHFQQLNDYRLQGQDLKALGYGRQRPVKLSDGSMALYNPLTGETQSISGPASQISKSGDGSLVSVNKGTNAVTQLTRPTPPRPHAGGQGGQAGGGLSDEAITQLAEQWYTTGKPPQLGRAGSAYLPVIASHMAQLHPGANLGAQGAGYHANTSSLAEAQKLSDATDANEGKALADMEVLEGTMKPLLNTNSPWVNRHGRELEENAGNPDVTAFRTARLAAVATINKVLNSGTLTESARKEADDLLRGDASLAQLHAGLQVLRQDMARSKAAMHKRVSDTQSRISGKPVPLEAPGGSLSLDNSAGGPTVTEERALPDGRVIQKLSDGSKRLKP